MNTESDTPRTDAVIKASWEYLSVPTNTITAEFARQLERELNNAMAALRNLTDEIGKHEGASMMHPRLTRAIAAAKKITTETK